MDQPTRDTADEASREKIALGAEDFWRLRALIRDVQAIEFEFASVRSEFANRVADAVARRDGALAEIGRKYGLTGPGRYTLDDTTCSLIWD
jgi:hypothetical protein